MQKMPGVSANAKWDTLSMSAKERTVSQVTEYLKAMFALRFDHDVYVGPIVSIPFFSAVDGVIRVPDADPPSHIELSQYRGPSFLRAEPHILSQYRTTVLQMKKRLQSRLELGERVLREALELCSVYPGNDQPGRPI
ncbi:hypothetical protein F5141DRAFT_1079933, partial [Pisolithus sp. B1]